MPPRCRRDAAEMPPRCRRDAAEMPSGRFGWGSCESRDDTCARARGWGGCRMVRWEVTGQVWGTRAVVLPHMDMWLVGRGAWRGNVPFALFMDHAMMRRSLFFMFLIFCLLALRYRPLGVVWPRHVAVASSPLSCFSRDDRDVQVHQTSVAAVADKLAAMARKAGLSLKSVFAKPQLQ